MASGNPLELIEEIYKAYYVYLKNYLIGLTKSDENADDIIQELFSKILVNPSMLKMKESLKQC